MQTLGEGGGKGEGKQHLSTVYLFFKDCFGFFFLKMLNSHFPVAVLMKEKVISLLEILFLLLTEEWMGVHINKSEGC